MKHLECICVGAILAGSFALPAAAEEARDVVMEHLRGYGALDAEKMTAPFADGATLITTERVYRGKAEILEFMEDLVAEFSQPEISTESHAMVVEGNVVMMTWSAESPDNRYDFGVDTYLVEDGEIILLTTAAEVTPK